MDILYFWIWLGTFNIFSAKFLKTCIEYFYDFYRLAIKEKCKENMAVKKPEDTTVLETQDLTASTKNIPWNYQPLKKRSETSTKNNNSGELLILQNTSNEIPKEAIIVPTQEDTTVPETQDPKISTQNIPLIVQPLKETSETVMKNNENSVTRKEKTKKNYSKENQETVKMG